MENFNFCAVSEIGIAILEKIELDIKLNALSKVVFILSGKINIF